MAKFKHYWRIILPISIAIIIWIFSSASGDTSEGQSLAVANWLGWPHALTRKIAHIILFSAFGASLACYSRGRYPKTFPRYDSLIANLIVVVTYGAIDEIHQLLIAGRSGAFSDVILDSVAGLGGILLYVALYCFVWQKLIAKKSAKRKFR